MIQSQESCFSLRMMCRVLSVSRSGYYDWKRRPPSVRTQANEQLAEDVQKLFDQEKCRAGSPRITKGLQAQGKVINHKRIEKIMRAKGLRAKAAKKFKATTNSNHNLPVAPNLLLQDFSAERPDQKYVSDITYIWTEEGWLYLAVVMDLYSRLVVGWSMSDRMTKQLVCDALQMALWSRKKPNGVVVHSDRGSQYCSKEYQKLLNEHDLICSMSKRGDCYDNAAMESWNHSFKVEAIHGEKFLTRAEATNHVFEYIGLYYNRKRLHSRLGYLSPEAFEALNFKNVA
jgi:transposase InsO family protein